MRFDNYNLVVDGNNKETSALETAIFYVKNKIKKEEIDREFNKKYSVRPKRDFESFEEYDDYLTRHNHMYEDVLSNQGMAYLMNLDINFHYAMCSLSVGDKLSPHPDLFYKNIEKSHIPVIASALLLYSFTDYMKLLPKTSLIGNVIINKRQTPMRYLMDLYLLSKKILTKYNENDNILVEISKRYGPTFLTKYL